MKLFVNTFLLFFLSLTCGNADIIIAYDSNNKKPSSLQLIDFETLL